MLETIKAKKLPAQLEGATADDYQKTLRSATNFIPTWVKFAAALALRFETGAAVRGGSLLRPARAGSSLTRVDFAVLAEAVRLPR